MNFWAYMLHCRGGYFYVGHTDDLERRIAQHQMGDIAGFTADHLPVEHVWSQDFGTREEAKEAEKRIKGWSRTKKLALIRGDWERISSLAKSKNSPSTSSGKSGVGERPVFENESIPTKPDYPELVEGLSFSLHPHPDTPCRAIDCFSVSMVFDGPDCLELTFCLQGKIDRIRLPANGSGSRCDDLWQYTCFEMFSRNFRYSAYEELNFSPSTDWAAYDFDSYRTGMRPTPCVLAPEIAVIITPAELRMTAKASLAEGAGPWDVGFSAVIEETDGTKSYWALAHPPGKPDFHAPTCFAAVLPAPEQP
ncbi:MAG: GIY-YIG nuclease family protein [Novosphingobium sp.]